MRRPRAFLLTFVAATVWVVLSASPAAANRFGPPWMARVVAEQAMVYSQPDSSSSRVGPVQHGAIVIVLGEQTDSTSHEWTQTTLGFVPSIYGAELKAWQTFLWDQYGTVTKLNAAHQTSYLHLTDIAVPRTPAG